MVFKKNNPGCCCGNPCIGAGNTLSFLMNGCPLGTTAVPGASVTFTGPDAPYTTTTDASGIASYFEPSPGTYTISWTYGALSGTTSAVITNACNSSSGSLGSLLTRANQIHGSNTYICCTSSCIWPLPRILFLTDSRGTTQISYSVGFGGVGAWQGSFDDGTEGYSYNLKCDGTLTARYWKWLPFGGGKSGCSGSGHSGPVPLGIEDGQTINVSSLCGYPFPGATGTWGATGLCGYDSMVTGGVAISV